MNSAQTTDSDYGNDRSQNKKKDALSESSWRLEDHICRKCFGRLVSRAADGDNRLYRCTNCGAQEQSADASSVCCCGMKIRKVGRGNVKSKTLVDAGVRCIPNPTPTAAFPSEFIASEVARK